MSATRPGRKVPLDRGIPAPELLSKSFQLSGEVFPAMQARGFRDEVYVLAEFRMSHRDCRWRSPPE